MSEASRIESLQECRELIEKAHDVLRRLAKRTVRRASESQPSNEPSDRAMVENMAVGVSDRLFETQVAQWLLTLEQLQDDLEKVARRVS